MLNKKVCLHCWLENRPYLVKNITSEQREALIADFEIHWEYENTSCFVAYIGFTPIEGPPPSKCPFRLEQLVNQEAPYA